MAMFIALIPGVMVAVAVGLHLLMLGDGITGKRGSFLGIVIGVVGVPLAAVGVYITAAVLAWRASGYTFYYPIAALVIGGLLTVGLSGLADRIVRRA